MTTLKPQLVRADTLDLQDHNAPSAKDHTRQPTHPAPYGQGPAAPHQTQALRNAEQESYQQQKYTPRLSEDHSQAHFPDEPNFYDDPDDEIGSEQHPHDGGPNGMTESDNGFEDGEQIDDDLEDDLMDKISSSPSIDDGKYTLPIWPPRADSVDSGKTLSPSMPTRGNANSSSPFTSTPEYFPLSTSEQQSRPTSHHHGGYGGISETGQAKPSMGVPGDYPIQGSTTHHISDSLETDFDNIGHSLVTLDYQEINKYLLPEHDPLLDNSFDEADDQSHGDDDSEWEDEEHNALLPDLFGSDDDIADFEFTDDTRFIDSGWGGECLREIEDIDFEFVYALHTFVATVEGQANATKGDTMVLLDDSNSYWWLVRVVKDGSIGYLPAEHIETPTERLARLNKHRNIDLSQTMLGDNPEKSKNPLKKAMRRRNAKTVQFTAPTYYEPSDYEYSDEEDDEDSQIPIGENGAQGEEEEVDRQDDSELEAAGSAALAINTQQNGSVEHGIKRVASDENLADIKQLSPVKVKSPDTSGTLQQDDESLGRSRKGVVRNTDSFFKDDSVETRKISLTPRLLRNDPEITEPAEQEAQQRLSLETADKALSSEEKPKDDKKKKEKKGILSGLFKRKDKGSKTTKSDGDEFEKLSEESVRVSPHSKESLDSFSVSDSGPERKASKLQKQPPLTLLKASPIENRPIQKEISGSSPIEGSQIPQPTGPAPVPPTLRPIMTEQPRSYQSSDLSPLRAQNQSQSQNTSPIEKRSIFAPITTMLKSSSSNSSLEYEHVVKPVKSKRAKKRFAIEDSDSEDDTTPTVEQHHKNVSLAGDLLDSGHQRSESPVHVSAIDASMEDNEATPVLKAGPLVVDTSMKIATPGSTAHGRDSDHSTNTTKASPTTELRTPSTSRSTPTWSDASLRSYMDNDQGMKDLLIIIHDKSNVTPAGPDHPYVGNLFINEKARLAEMQSSLDSLLTSWISRKNSSLLSR